jgi:hypothetical protein
MENIDIQLHKTHFHNFLQLRALIQIEVFWVMTPYSNVEVGNVGNLQHHYSVSQHKTPRMNLRRREKTLALSP